jgi:hypothetical protein
MSSLRGASGAAGCSGFGFVTGCSAVVALAAGCSVFFVLFAVGDFLAGVGFSTS